MTINKKLLTVVMVLWAVVAQAQWQQSDITRVTYQSVFGGMFSNSFAIMLEIKPDQTIKMYNDTYDSTLGKTLGAMAEEEKQIEMSAEDVKNLFLGYPSYFAGRITNTEYRQLADAIIQIQNDTSYVNVCCCDIPYKVLKVYSKKGRKMFLQCGKGNDKKIVALMKMLDSIAYKRGYKPIDKFDLNKIR